MMAAVHNCRVSKAATALRFWRHTTKAWGRQKVVTILYFPVWRQERSIVIRQVIIKWIVYKASSGGKWEGVIRGPLYDNFIADSLNT